MKLWQQIAKAKIIVPYQLKNLFYNHFYNFNFCLGYNNYYLQQLL